MLTANEALTLAAARIMSLPRGDSLLKSVILHEAVQAICDLKAELATGSRPKATALELAQVAGFHRSEAEHLEQIVIVSQIPAE